jgi:hypothetical protein
MATAPIIHQEWKHTLPNPEDQQYDLQLLTICGVSVLGRWAGEFGQFYVGWASLLGASKSQQQPYANNYYQPHEPQRTWYQQ